MWYWFTQVNINDLHLKTQSCLFLLLAISSHQQKRLRATHNDSLPVCWDTDRRPQSEDLWSSVKIHLHLQSFAHIIQTRCSETPHTHTSDLNKATEICSEFSANEIILRLVTRLRIIRRWFRRRFRRTSRLKSTQYDAREQTHLGHY